MDSPSVLANRYYIKAYHVAEALKLKEADRLFSTEPILKSAWKRVYQEDEASYVFVYNFGSVIFFNFKPERQNSIMEQIKKLIRDEAEIVTMEEYSLELNADAPSEVGFEKATLASLKLDSIDLIALILAQSTALDYFEQRVDEMLLRTSQIGEELRASGRFLASATHLKKFIGQCMATKRHLVASLFLLDKPDEVWEDQELEKLYKDTIEMFEIRERYRTLDYKLRMIQENLALIANLLQNRHANFLEWAIIVLIAVEIVLFVFELFFQG